LTDFYDRASKTAEVVLNRNAIDKHSGTEAGHAAHQQAKAMLMAEKFPSRIA
jgi:hypothetical protein